jgi:hypothetical protein
MRDRLRWSVALALVAGVAVLAAASASSAAKAPIKIMVIAPWDNAVFDFQDVPTILGDAAAALNKKGGINGAQVQVVSCNDKNDGNEAEKCARQAVSEGVAALVGGFTIFGNRIWPIIEQQQIPWIGDPVIAPQDYTSALSFPVTPGGGLLAFSPALLAGRTCKRIALQVTPSAASSTAFFQAGLHASSKDYVSQTLIPSTATDLSSYAVQVQQKNPDCLYLSGTELLYAQWIPALKAQGAIGKYKIFTTSPAGLTDAVIAKFPQETNGWIAGAYFPLVSQPVWKEYRTMLARADNLGKYVGNIGSGTEQRSYVGWTVFVNVAKTIKGAVTPTSLLNAMNHSCNVKTGGIAPRLNFCKENPVPEIRRLINTNVTYYVARNGKFQMLSPGFHDMLPTYRRGANK